MSNKKPLISIVVLNWNGKRFIDNFMESVKGQVLSGIEIEVIFTDNASSDDSVAYYRETYFDDNRYRLVLNDGNYGYAKGNNLGIVKANGDFILVCNNDLVLDKMLVQELYRVIEDTNSDLVVPKLMFKNKKGYINNAGSILQPNNSWPIHEIGIHEKDEGQYSEIREISAFCGACVLFRRSYLGDVGLYDNKFFMYFEDGDLSWRGQRLGKKYYFAPNAIANHIHTGSSKEGSPLFIHYVYRNRMLILIKNARVRVVLSGVKKTINDFFVLKVKNMIRSLSKKYSKRKAIVEFFQGQMIIWSVAALTPYCLLKRWGILKEQKL